MLSKLSDRALGSFAWVLAFIAFDVFRFRRKIILKNLQIAFGEKYNFAERKKIGRASMYNFGLTALEFLRSPHVNLSSRVTIEGLDNIKGALEKHGVGAYALCFHMGNWEAFASACTHQITDAWLIVKKVGSDEVNRYVSETRDINKIRYIHRVKKGEGYKVIVQKLTENQIIGFVLDQARPGEPRFNFFGHPAKTNTSLAAIWRKNPSPVLPAYIVRKSPGVHEANFLPPLDLKQTDDQEADIVNLTNTFNAAIEKIIAKHPEHYLWMHNRWK